MSEPEHRHLDFSLRGELLHAEPMSRYTSWRAGGVADRAYVPADLSDLAHFMRTLPKDEQLYTLGLGSNLLVRDGGIRGTVVLLHRALNSLRLVAIPQGGGAIYAEAGVAAPKVAKFAAKHSLDGAEFMAGIPGTVGGALAMNAGCYGTETWDFVVSVTTIDRTGVVRERGREDFEIAYRHIRLKQQLRQLEHEETRAAGRPALLFDEPSEEWFVAAHFGFPMGGTNASEQKIKELLNRRLATQPLSQPNAGSVFRNPEGHHAARLIEACGLKGYAMFRSLRQQVGVGPPR